MAAPRDLTSGILVAIIQCWVWVAAISPPASCSGSLDRGRAAFIGYSFPSTEGPQYDGNEFKFSWDAGILGRALHLTADGVYEPPVTYPPDSKRSAGHVRFSQGFSLAIRSQSYDGIWSELQEASFNTSFTMSISGARDYTATGHDDGGLLLEVLPLLVSNGGFDRAIYFPFSSTTSGDMSVEIGKLQYYYDQGSFGLYVSIAPANKTPANYTVWIEYDAKQHNLSVYVEEEGKAKPERATLHAPLNITDIVTDVIEWYTNYGDSRAIRVRGYSSRFGLFASKNRSLPSLQPVVYSWNLTMERLLPTFPTFGIGGGRRRIGWFLVRLLPPVLTAAAAAAFVSVVACCLTSRYRALSMKLKLAKAMRRLPGIPQEFRYAAVKKATKNFHESMRLGSGGFGAVYKGAMIATCDGDDGRQRLQYVEVAVKKFTRKENSSYDDFMAEVAVISRLRHRNIVPLIGWCYENRELLLIYRYMPNGSLDQHLFREKRHQQLPILQWQTRYELIKDIAAGLHYVHHEYERAVLHRDIKASNIMLDADFRGRLGDFGLARVMAFDDKTSFTDTGVAGTWGFIAPEYAVSHKATRKTDVYAFGVLVLEVVTGKRSLADAADSAFPLLIDWVWWLHGEGRLLEAVENELITMADFSPENATRLLLLGLACSDPNPSERPSMDQVVQVIAMSMPPPAVPPVKPAFVWPPGGEQLLLSDDPDDDDDFVVSDHRDSDRRHSEGTDHCCDSLATGIKPSSEITQRKSRNVVETNISQDIEKCV